MLLGEQVFFKIIKADQIKINDSITLQNSVFNYIVTGGLPTADDKLHSFLLSEKEGLENLISKFWQLESIEDESLNLYSQTKFCEYHFVNNHRRDQTGHYILQISFLKEPSCLGESKQTPIRRLNSLWRKLEANPTLQQLYRNFIHEYLDMRHMEQVFEVSEPTVAYYMPHHGVLRHDSKSTPLRTVFDASRATSTGESLNSILANGGVIQDELFAILLRFRKNRISLISYIKKMFHMIFIDESQRDLLRIVWKESIDDSIKTYKMNRVVYGTTCAPYLAQRVLKQLVMDDGHNYPLAASAASSDMYMDDLLTDAAHIYSAKQLKEQLIALSEEEASKLHKWFSNCIELLANSEVSDGDVSFTIPDETKAQDFRGDLKSTLYDINDNELYQREFKKNPKDPVCLVLQGQEVLPIINNCSSFTRLQRVIGWCVRFVRNAKNSLQPNEGNLTSPELFKSLMCLVKNVQANSFAQEIQCLKRGQQLPNLSSLINLSPFLDEQDILRVVDRLKNSNLPIERKHPILLPYSNHFSDLIINHFHVLYLHTGAEATLANIRTKFWLINGRNYVRKIIRKCIPCLKVSAKGSNQVRADLPSSRVNISRVFTRVGINFCGPFSIKLFSGRFKKSYKCYICIFICFVVKSVHLEIVNSCSTDAFIGALKRFIARRGTPNDIYSDNGTNFVGANNELRKILKDLFNKESTGKIEDFIASEGIFWHFNPPATPHFGGLWEGGVKSLKSYLKRVVGNTVLTHEEFSTLVTLVEAVLNARPLCNLSSDPNDYFVLTRAHFLVGSSLTALPDPDLTEVPINRLNRWQLVQRLSQIFWKK
ncbi:hypothetical protein AVEN_35187-1 [Araneus ventricosus]|uniref:Integrase catalytic domain-containing protein n=1 Tax=Araneus ventricosus TaxID=182803 RepID=A0A4Y2QK08_ARAVE|nr:hypothetical protein AVEN_35187-1 [Araneus ventricosus]